MNITYSILWFDDSEEYLQSMGLEINYLEKTIDSWGFEPDIQIVFNPDKFSQNPFNDFNLIVVDYNLSEHGYGQEFIKQIREHGLYTEVIFYSSTPLKNLWDAIKENELGGVFVANRDSLVGEIEKVAKQSIEKIFDLANMRGLVMAEVGEIDHILDEIICLAMGALDDNDKEIEYDKFCEREHRHLESSDKKIKKFQEQPSIKDMLELCNSQKRWNLFNSIGKKSPALKDNELGKFDDVLKFRNVLAHGRPKKEQDGSYTFCHRGKQHKYNSEKSRSFRQSIREYKAKFEKIRESLKSQ